MTIGNGKSIRDPKILSIIVLSLFVLIKDVTVPLIKQSSGGGSSSQTNTEVVERLARLEEQAKRLELIPINVATLTAVTAGMKESIDRLERKFDEQIGKGK